MRAKEYPLLVQCIEEGVAAGYNRAFKYVDKPDSHLIQEQIIKAVLDSICEAFYVDQDL